MQQQTTPAPSTSTAITVQGVEMPILEFQGQRVVTMAMVDRVHQRPEGTARKRFNDHKARLIAGEDYFVRTSDEARQMGFTAPNGLTLLTESGYLTLVKSLTDDLAWQVQRVLVKSYFRAKEAVAPKPEPQPAPKQPGAAAAAQLAEATRQLADMSLRLCEQVELLSEDAAAWRALVSQEGPPQTDTITLRKAEKDLGFRPGQLFAWMRRNGWISRVAGGGYRIEMAALIEGGVLCQRMTVVYREDGAQVGCPRVRVTRQGLEFLREVLPRAEIEGGSPR